MKRWFIILLLLTACAGSTASETAPQATNISQPERSAQSIQITTADGQPYITIDLAGDYLVTYTNNGTSTSLRGKLKDADKRIYTDQSGQEIAVVAYKSDSFKLRSPDASLHWKVKLKETKIEILDSEDGPILLKLDLKHRSDQRIDIIDETSERGKVQWDSDKIKVKNSEGVEMYRVNSNVGSASYGVLLLQEANAQDQAILITEILGKGQ